MTLGPGPPPGGVRSLRLRKFVEFCQAASLPVQGCHPGGPGHLGCRSLSWEAAPRCLQLQVWPSGVSDRLPHRETPRPRAGQPWEVVSSAGDYSGSSCPSVVRGSNRQTTAAAYLGIKALMPEKSRIRQWVFTWFCGPL